jgi:glycosyltransferase involved in cell wall biosynthesis
MKMSLIVVTKNWESTLEQTIQSVGLLADQVIIINIRPTEKTAEVTERFGTLKKIFTWNKNYSEVRNLGLGFAKHPWVLSLEANEWIDEKLHVEIEKTKNSGTEGAYGAFLLPNSPFISSSLDMKQKKLILFKNRKWLSFKGRVHDDPIESLVEHQIAWAQMEGFLHRDFQYPPGSINFEYDYQLACQWADDAPTCAKAQYIAGCYALEKGYQLEAIDQFRKAAESQARRYFSVLALKKLSDIAFSWNWGDVVGREFLEKAIKIFDSEKKHPEFSYSIELKNHLCQLADETGSFLSVSRKFLADAESFFP